jgi:crossover junction endodeoxyribonuclease RuvC
MRIIGIDPGLNLTGYGCVQECQGAEPRLVEAGVFRLTPRKPIAFRLAQLHEDLSEVLDQLSPDVMVVEQVFSHYRHVRTAMLMGHARGVILLAAQIRGIQIGEMAATEVKKALTGHGHATKRQIQLTVMSQCGLTTLPEPPDVADAIALALCGARRREAAVEALAAPQP